MSSAFWHGFCRHGENFTAWKSGDFGHCFEQIVLICPSHTVLALFSAYYIAAAKENSRRAYTPLPWFVKLRLFCSILLCLLAILQILITRILNDISVSASDIVTACFVSFSWIVHSVYIHRLTYLFWTTWRGATSVVVVYFLTILSVAAQIHTNILLRVNNSASHNLVEEICVYTGGFFQLCYLITLIPRTDRVSLLDNQSSYAVINEEVDEYSSLLGRSVRGYSSLPTPSQQSLIAEDNVNCFSWLTFHWVQPILTKGANKTINAVTDVFILPVRLNTLSIFTKFTSALIGKSAEQFPSRRSFMSDSSISSTASSIPDVGFSSAKHANEEPPTNISLFRVLNKVYGMEYYSLGILKLLADCFGFGGPILLNLLVKYMEEKSEPEQNGYYYAIGLLLTTLFGCLCSTQFDYNCNIVGYKVRASIITSIYRKSLSVSTVHVHKFSSGQIINFMSTDTDRIVNFCTSFHAFWSLPFQIAASLYLLHQQVGLAFLAGLGFAIILIPINRWLAIKIGQLSKAMMEQKDNRVKLMNEILFGIRVVKFYTWEDHFTSRILGLREAELKSLKGRKYLDAMCVYFWATTPVLISILTFTTYSLLGNTLTAAKVFTSLSLFLMLIGPLNAFPWVLNGLMEAWVSLQRVQEFIKLRDLDPEQYYSSNAVLLPECVFHMTDAEFSWKAINDTATDCPPSRSTSDPKLDIRTAPSTPSSTNTDPSSPGSTGNEKEDKTFYLKDINLHITKGEFIGVIGKVGSGKSSLFSCLLAEMHRVRGHVRVNDLSSGFAVTTQEAWIQHATIRDNILFGRQFNSRRYERTIDACALSEDFKMLPAGDQTEVGENGVTLSGGQKARIALARAVYQNKDVYILDDPFAAVDAHVAQQLYQKCIMGILGNKTRILLTHHTRYLVNANLVILLEDGKIKKKGTPAEVLNSVDLETTLTNNNPAGNQSGEIVGEPVNIEDGSLVEAESKEKGVLKLGVYKYYWSAVGACLAPSVLVALLCMQASRNINDWWLSYWVSHSKDDTPTTNHSHFTHLLTQDQEPFVSPLKHSNQSVMFYLTVYGCLAGANSIFTLLRAFLFAYGGICAARSIHRDLLGNILKAPVSFFDTTPLGRIVNRFSSDIYSIDDSLPFIMNIFLAQIYGILGTLVIVCYGLPWFGVVLLPLGLLYYKIQNYYRHTSREIKRLSSVSLSPIYAHFSETITGMTTIRAMREQERFQRENLDRLDHNQRAQFTATAVANWLSFRLQMLGVVMVTAIAFIAVLEHHFQSISPGLVGLALSYALSVTNLLSSVVNSFVETEKQMVSVERAQDYIRNIPNERSEGSLMPPPYWPIQGSIVFDHVRMRYRINLPYALEKVTFEVEPGEKIGIVGRTGSGKSSLFLALFRMVEISRGSIFIDGIDIVHVDLKDIRSRLAIIPQDPFLFSGSVRENVDPIGQYKDGEIWSVLRKCHLGQVVERLGGLEGDVGERGRCFSVGQRQLMCLARALLTRAKILCIDEATASVDLETDLLIQQTIRSEFIDSTCLTIAHRINTIMDSDRVLVMNEGRVAEFAPPGRLLLSPDTLFYKLVHEH